MSRDRPNLAFCASNTPLDAAETFSVIIRDRSASLCGEASRCHSTVLICMFAMMRSPTNVTGLKQRRGILRTLLQHSATEQLDIDVANWACQTETAAAAVRALKYCFLRLLRGSVRSSDGSALAS
jgi:hypothetical protein